MSPRVLVEHHIRSPARELLGQQMRPIDGGDGIDLARPQKHLGARQVDRVGRTPLQGRPRGEQHRTHCQTRPTQQQGRAGVGTVGKPTDHDPSGVELVVFQGHGEPVGQLVGAGDHVLDVEDPLTQTTEPPVQSVLVDLAAWGQQSRTRSQGPPQRQQIVLVGAGAVQQHQRGCVRGRGRFQDVFEVLHGSGHRFTFSSGRCAAICSRRGSSHGGSFKACPSSSKGSSWSKPGPSVAISSSTPPGSRK